MVQTAIIDIQNKNADLKNQNDSLKLKANEFDSRIVALETLATTLEQQMAEFKASIATPINIAQLDLNAQDIIYLKSLLGMDRVTDPGDVDILGKLSSKITETGAMVITVTDKDRPTIGKDTISAGETSVVVKTKAASKNSKIYITPVGSTGNEVIYLDQINDGESFAVKIDDPVKDDINFNWWVVEEKNK